MIYDAVESKNEYLYDLGRRESGIYSLDDFSDSGRASEDLRCRRFLQDLRGVGDIDGVYECSRGLLETEVMRWIWLLFFSNKFRK